MDNASIHISNRIVDLIESKGARIIYLPPYSPDLNPIELMFALYKKNLERFGIYHDWWWACHLISLDRIDPQAVRNSFRKCHIPAENYPHPTAEADQEEELAAAIIMFSIIANLN
jgi:hypothetical protein